MWIQGLACGALLTFAAPTALLFAVLLAPIAICLLAEPGSRGSLAKGVGLACIATAIGPTWHLWQAGDTLDAALATLSDPRTIGIAWGAGAAAWASCQILPVIIQTATSAKVAARINAINAELKSHQEDWMLDEEA